MEKRTERNKELYVRVNASIKEKVQKTSNDEFKSTHTTLQNINPHLFGGEVTNKVEVETNKKSKKHIVKTALIFLGIIIIIVVIAVVISKYAK